MKGTEKQRRALLKDYCRIAHESLLEYMQTALDLPDGLPGIVMCIHTFGEYLDFHPHLHALLADGLFMRDGLFHVMPEVDIQPLDDRFHAIITLFLWIERNLR
ncbi:MAG: transposase [Lentisphaerota bacterium]